MAGIIHTNFTLPFVNCRHGYSFFMQFIFNCLLNKHLWKVIIITSISIVVCKNQIQAHIDFLVKFFVSIRLSRCFQLNIYLHIHFFRIWSDNSKPVVLRLFLCSSVSLFVFWFSHFPLGQLKKMAKMRPLAIENQVC